MDYTSKGSQTAREKADWRYRREEEMRKVKRSVVADGKLGQRPAEKPQMPDRERASEPTRKA